MLFLPYAPFLFVRFCEHHVHLAPLCLSKWLPNCCFSLPPITHFQPLKLHFLMCILLFLAMFLMIRNGFVYTIAVNIYAYRLAFSSILPCVQHQNSLRLAPKCLAFSTKTHCIQHQNALRLAPKCTAFSSKQHKVWCKLRFYAMRIHFVGIHNCPLFASKQTFTRIGFLRSGGQLVAENGTHNVKKCAEIFTYSWEIDCLRTQLFSSFACFGTNIPHLCDCTPLRFFVTLHRQKDY